MLDDCGTLPVRAWANGATVTRFPSESCPPAGTNPKDCDLPYSNGICNNLRLFFCELEGWPCAVRRGAWAPRAWHFPGIIDRESDDFVHNAWENREFCWVAGDSQGLLPTAVLPCRILCMLWIASRKLCEGPRDGCRSIKKARNGDS